MEPAGDPARAVGPQPGLSPVGAILAALHEEKIRFIVVGMTAAILHGAPCVTIDTDVWLDLGSRSYMRPINMALKHGAEMVRQTVVVTRDGRLVNFCYSIQGVASFATEYRRSAKYIFEGVEVRVLLLERVIRSKEAAGRPKDLITLPILRDVAKGRDHFRAQG